MCLERDRLDGKKASRIKHDIPSLDFNDHSNCPKLIDETIEKMVKMRKVFKKYFSFYSSENLVSVS